jgi:hypothetical protein
MHGQKNIKIDLFSFGTIFLLRDMEPVSALMSWWIRLLSSYEIFKIEVWIVSIDISNGLM